MYKRSCRFFSTLYFYNSKEIFIELEKNIALIRIDRNGKNKWAIEELMGKLLEFCDFENQRKY